MSPKPKTPRRSGATWTIERRPIDREALARALCEAYARSLYRAYGPNNEWSALSRLLQAAWGAAADAAIALLRPEEKT